MDAAGREVGPEYQQVCIASWHTAGFEPISVNSAHEPAPVGVVSKRVSRDASQVTGRPHIFIADMLDCGVEASAGGVFAIANADLVLSPDLGSLVAALRPGEIIISRRIDINDVGSRTGPANLYGFDFFAAHSEDVVTLPDIGLIFGAPWWDHWLPILMRMHGCRLVQIEPAVYHLVHNQAWSWDTWQILGHQFRRAARPLIVDQHFEVLQREAARRRKNGWFSNLRRNALKFVRGETAKERLRRLHALAQGNVRYIDEQSLVQTRAR